MVSARFRAGETSARLTWIGRTAGSRRREPVAATGPEGPVIRVAAGQVIQGRSVLGSAGLLRSSSTSLLRATRLQPLLYSPQPRQIWQTGKVPAYGTLPAVHRDRQISVYFQSSHWSRKIGHSPVYGQQ